MAMMRIVLALLLLSSTALAQRTFPTGPRGTPIKVGATTYNPSLVIFSGATPSLSGGQLTLTIGGGSPVPSSRTISTTSPIRCDGGASCDLSANRTLSLTSDTITVNTNSPITGGAAVALGGSLTLSCAACALNTVDLIAGDGLTGGGTIASNRTFTVGAGTGITVNANDVALDTAHARNVDHSAVSVTAGAGLTGGGDISATRTVDVGAGNGISVAADSVAIDTAVTADISTAQTLSNKTLTDVVGDETFVKEAPHTIKVAASTTAATAGGALTINSANGNGAAAGALTIDTGTGTAGGAITVGPTNGLSVAVGKSTGAYILLNASDARISWANSNRFGCDSLKCYVGGATIGWDWSGTSYAPASDGGQDIGSASKRVGKVTAKRYHADGTDVVTGDFAASAGWGDTAAFSSPAGSDQAGSIVITSQGAGIAANPTITLTFKDGTWTTIPQCIASIFATSDTPSTNLTQNIPVTSSSATAITWTYYNLPVTANTYSFRWHCIGI